VQQRIITHFLSPNPDEAGPNGALNSEFPLNVTGDLRSGNQDFSIGAGRPLIHVTTTNGGVKLKKAKGRSAEKRRLPNWPLRFHAAR
jgi:hypothetical protein